MMASTEVHLSLVRVDDRLLHGQVVLNWVRALRPQRLAVVIDGDPADADLQRAILGAVAPREISLWVGRAADLGSALLESNIPPNKIMVLLPNPLVARALYDAGVHYEALNLGCLGAAPGRVRVGAQVSLSRIEMEALRYLASKGVAVTTQALPGDAPVSLEDLARRMERYGQQPGCA